MNLLEETLEILEEYDKTPGDVLWVGTVTTLRWRERDPFSYSWEEFKVVADINYDNSFGHNEISSGLLVVGKDWWLERGEYDGSEWWEFKSYPAKPMLSHAPEKADLLE